MKTFLKQAAIDQKPILAKIMQLYCYDCSRFFQLDLNADGEYEYQWLNSYWLEKDRFPFLIETGGKISGFALVRKEGEFYSMAEFFILRKYRLQGLGGKIAREVFDRFPGKWKVFVLKANGAALLFWEKTISTYTQGRFAIRSEKDLFYEFELS